MLLKTPPKAQRKRGRQAKTVASDPLKSLGDRVRQTRARRGMTRRQLARDSGVSERYLAQIESGHGNISVLVLRRLAKALNVSVDVLQRPLAFVDGWRRPGTQVETEDRHRRACPGDPHAPHIRTGRRVEAASYPETQARMGGWDKPGHDGVRGGRAEALGAQ